MFLTISCEFLKVYYIKIKILRWLTKEGYMQGYALYMVVAARGINRKTIATIVYQYPAKLFCPYVTSYVKYA